MGEYGREYTVVPGPDDRHKRLQDERDRAISDARRVRETNAMLWGEIHKMEDLARNLENRVVELEAELDRVWEQKP